MQSNTFFNNKLLGYIATDEGAGQYSGFLATAEKHYPQYVEEIRGMASGANITFEKVPYYLEQRHISNCSTRAFIQAHVASFD